MPAWDAIDLSESMGPETPREQSTLAEIRAAAEIVVWLEDEMRLDVRKLRVRVRNGHVVIQGSVSTREEKNEIELKLPLLPGVRGVETNISVLDE